VVFVLSQSRYFLLARSSIHTYLALAACSAGTLPIVGEASSSPLFLLKTPFHERIERRRNEFLSRDSTPPPLGSFTVITTPLINLLRKLLCDILHGSYCADKPDIERDHKNQSFFV
jgi:hypothetical protein